MSINHFMNKIKGQAGIDSTTFLCLCVVILVGLGSFGLGRLSVSNTTNNNDIKLENTNDYVVKGGEGESVEVESSIETSLKEKKYLASKNGKLYYTISCSGAKRIREENKVWFASREDAEKSGYSLSSSCK